MIRWDAGFEVAQGSCMADLATNIAPFQVVLRLKQLLAGIQPAYGVAESLLLVLGLADCCWCGSATLLVSVIPSFAHNLAT